MAVVTAEVEEGPQLEKLRVLHEAFVAERPAWVERIEVMYVDRDVLRTLADRPRGRLAGLPRASRFTSATQAANPPRLAQRDNTRARRFSRSSTARPWARCLSPYDGNEASAVRLGGPAAGSASWPAAQPTAAIASTMIGTLSGEGP
jgi:hypothetical protein